MSLDLERIRKSTRRIRKYVKRNPKRPSAESVHKLRTSVRHVGSALVTLELDGKGLGSLSRDLEKTRRLAGKLRDMDVLTANALGLDWRGEQDCMVRLLEHLGAKRGKRARKLRTAIAKRRRRIQRSLERGLDRAEQVTVDARASEDSSAVGAAVVRAIQFSSKLSRPGRLTRNNLHEYRRKVKELRDILRLSSQAADTALVEKLDKVKGAIGDWHDCVVLTDIASDALDHGTSCALLKRIQATRDSKYRDALSLANALASYLRPRRGKAKNGTAPIAKHVLEAATAIASESTQAH